MAVLEWKLVADLDQHAVHSDLRRGDSA